MYWQWAVSQSGCMTNWIRGTHWKEEGNGIYRPFSPLVSCFPLNKIFPYFWYTSYGPISSHPKCHIPHHTMWHLKPLQRHQEEPETLSLWLVHHGDGWGWASNCESQRWKSPQTSKIAHKMCPKERMWPGPSYHIQQHCKTGEISLELLRPEEEKEGNTTLLKKRLSQQLAFKRELHSLKSWSWKSQVLQWSQNKTDKKDSHTAAGLLQTPFIRASLGGRGG